jgi:hypothetical protein
MILPLFKRVLGCSIILGFLPFGLTSMVVRHLSMINSMNAILFLHYKIISHQELWSQIKKLLLLLLCKIISYEGTFFILQDNFSSRGSILNKSQIKCA